MILCGALGFIRRNIGVRFKATATTVSLSNLRPAPGSTKKVVGLMFHNISICRPNELDVGMAVEGGFVAAD